MIWETLVAPKTKKPTLAFWPENSSAGPGRKQRAETSFHHQGHISRQVCYQATLFRSTGSCIQNTLHHVASQHVQCPRHHNPNKRYLALNSTLLKTPIILPLIPAHKPLPRFRTPAAPATHKHHRPTHQQNEGRRSRNGSLGFPLFRDHCV